MITLFGAASSLILALVIIPNWPRPPKTASNSSEFFFFEHVNNSPFPETKQNDHYLSNSCSTYVPYSNMLCIKVYITQIETVL